MTKKAVIVCLLIFIFSGTSHADDQKKYAIGTRASYYMPYNNDIAIDLGNDIGGGINFLYNVQENLGLELSIEQFKPVVKRDIGVNNVNNKDVNIGEVNIGRIKTTQFLLKAQYKPIKKGKFIPYFGGGIGYLFNSFESQQSVGLITMIFDGSVITDIPSVDFTIENSFAYLLNAGADYYFTDKWSINIDIINLWAEVDTKTVTIMGKGGFEYEVLNITNDLDFDSLNIGLGIRYYF